MKKTIYIDVLIVLNFIINYFLLTLTSKFTRSLTSKKRIFLGSFIGSLFSLVILSPAIPVFIINILKLLISIIIVLLSFKLFNIKQFFKNVIVFYIISFIFAGVMLCVFLFLSPSNMLINNGVVYFNFSLAFLIILSVIIYFLFNFLISVYGSVPIKNTDYKVILKINNKSFIGTGFLDTGNNLRDLYTGKPIIIMSFDKIKNYIGEDVKNSLKNYFDDNINDLHSNTNIRFVPFNSVHSSGILPTITVQSISIMNENEKIITDNIMLSITNEEILDNQYDVLLNALIFT